jgi:arginyl-tRNA synthetase
MTTEASNKLTEVTPSELAAAITDAVRDTVGAGDLDVPVPESALVERPRNREHGDYASNVALRLARPAGRAPRVVAELLARRLGNVPGVAKVEVAGPGFLNISLESAAQGKLVLVITNAGDGYGRSAAFAGLRVNLEFVSANPTGPLHIGGARWAAVGDALARVLRATGADMASEYYFNDAGAQIDVFARSLLAAARGQPPPPDGYQGAYLGEIAARVISQYPDAAALPEADAVAVFRTEGVTLMLDEIKESLARFGVHFDVYRSEKDLREAGGLTAALDRLRTLGHTYQADGAEWLRTTDFGDDKDRVLVRRDGSWTYFAADCAYYLDRRARGFDRIVIMLGADHHGYTGRMKAMAACFGDDPQRTMEILTGQMVNLLQNGQPVRLSKRAGNVVTLDDLVEAVGADAARYALARASANSPIDLDVDLLTSQTAANPVFYVQYAYARLSALQRNAAEMGISLGTPDGFDTGLLTDEREADLLGMLGEFPRVVASAAELREVHRVARYLEQLAGGYHRWYDTCRILPYHNEPVTGVNMARLWLAEATQVVLRNSLALLGVSAPERM